jgi:general secretion pathway protein A
LRQLAQRVTARFHLDPLKAADTREYLRHRIAVAGATQFPFEESALRRLHSLSGGVPRLLNVLGERTLLAGYVHGKARIDAGLVDLAAKEVLPPNLHRGRAWRILGWCLLAGAVAGLFWLSVGGAEYL